MENIDNELFQCKSCGEHKPRSKYQKDCKFFRQCLTCRNKKYYKKDYFKSYYESHQEEIKAQATEFYATKGKLKHPLKMGRPKKVKVDSENLEQKSA